jgi:hypothetical protein
VYLYRAIDQYEKHREGEREVQHAIIRIIRDHFRDPSAPTWCRPDLDFTNDTFDGGDFHRAKFTGGEVSFVGAKYAGGEISFDGADFTPGCSITWDPFEFPAAWTALQEGSGGRTNHLCKSAGTVPQNHTPPAETPQKIKESRKLGLG